MLFFRARLNILFFPTDFSLEMFLYYSWIIIEKGRIYNILFAVCSFFFTLFHRYVFHVPFIELSLALIIWLSLKQVSMFCCSLLLRRFVFRMAEASAKRVTGDTPQGTMGRVQTAGEATSRPLSPSRLPLRAYRERRLGTRQVLLGSFAMGGRNNLIRLSLKKNLFLDFHHSK